MWERLSFPHFAGLGLQDPAPNLATIGRFRTQLATASLAKPVFAALEAHRAALVHETLADARVRRATGRQASFGYELHLGVLAGSKPIRCAMLTPANVNETQVAEQLFAGDAAFGTHARSAELRLQAIQVQLMRWPSHHHPRLSPAPRRRDVRIEWVRRPVAHLLKTSDRNSLTRLVDRQTAA